ncbi:hypothetical protein COP1_043438 [Malus domestica]
MEYIRSISGLSSIVNLPTMIFEDNAQQQHQNIEVKQIHSQDNLANLFTKSLPKSTFQKLIQGIGMRKLSELNRL